MGDKKLQGMDSFDEINKSLGPDHYAMQRDSQDILFTIGRRTQGWFPKELSQSLKDKHIDWMWSLTEWLDEWKRLAVNDEMDDGGRILAYANLGALVESWLKLFLLCHIRSYDEDPCKRKNGTIIKPKDIKFENLIEFFYKIWDIDEGLSDEYNEFAKKYPEWAKRVQHRRNILHIFTNSELGTNSEFLEDLEFYYILIDEIATRIPLPEYSLLSE